MEYFTNALKQYTDFSGRATRKDYWMFVLIYILLYIALLIIDAVLSTGWLSVLFTIGLLVPSISCAARRLHDTGRSGWWQLIYFIPLIGLIIMLVFLSQASHGDNKYGNTVESS
jgi:uncharacterized membrane protein YhaH (DUF805 family)